MKRFLNILLVALLSAAVACPVSAQERGRGHNTHTSQPSRNHSGGASRNKNSAHNEHNKGNKRADKKNDKKSDKKVNHARPDKNHNGRPNNGGSFTRPNNGHNGRPNHDNKRPDHNTNHNNNAVRPGGNHTGGNHNSIPGNHFGKPVGGPHNNHPGPNHRPTHAHHVPNHAPSRPMMPPPPKHWHHHRPTPPGHWRPGPRVPSFGTILGVTLGTAITNTINALINNGYYVSGYTNDAVYVNDAMMLNMMWPNTTLFYQSGRLVSSEFVYATPYYDTARYYSTYNALIRNYGSPVLSSNLSGGGFSSTWFGNDGRYVTLQYMSNYATDGEMRYYTTLSFGN